MSLLFENYEELAEDSEGLDEGNFLVDMPTQNYTGRLPMEVLVAHLGLSFNPVLKTAIVSDTKAAGTTGTAISADTWTKVPLNTEDYDPEALLSLSSSVIALTAGRWIVNAVVPFYAVNNFQARLRNTTDNTTALVGTTGYAYNATFASGVSTISGIVTTSVPSTNFELQAYADDAGSLGYCAGSMSASGLSCVYARISFQKISA